MCDFSKFHMKFLSMNMDVNLLHITAYQFIVICFMILLLKSYSHNYYLVINNVFMILHI